LCRQARSAKALTLPAFTYHTTTAPRHSHIGTRRAEKRRLCSCCHREEDIDSVTRIGREGFRQSH
jgi:hypothetical protein